MADATATKASQGKTPTKVKGRSPGEPLRQPLTGAYGSVLSLQQTVGNRAVSEILQAQEEERSGTVDRVSIARSFLNQASGSPLDSALQAEMESRFDYDFSQVKIHTSEQAEDSALALEARAYTLQNDIVFGKGQFVPETKEGKQRIAHELTHVIQQNQTIGTAISTHTAEQKAEQTAAQVADGHTATVNSTVSVGVQCDNLSEEEKRKAIQANTQCGSNRCHPDRRADSFKGSSLFAERPNLEALRQFAMASQKPPESPSPVEKKPEKGAHSSPPGLQPKPVSKKDSLTQGLEDLQNAQRNLGKPKSDQPRAFDRSPIMSPQEMAQLALARQAANQRAELEAKQKVTLADGNVISLASPPPEKKLTIPPPKPGEFTRDITFEGAVLAKANVEGERARIIHNLDVELKRIEGITGICRGSAQQFLEQWPIMRRLADLTAGANPPSMSIWFDVDTLIKQSQDAIKQGDLEKAIQLQEQANKALRNAQATWYRYKESNIGGAESIKTGAEYTRDGAKYTLMALATVASGGTALAVATGASVAIDVTEAATKAALGEKVDWGQVAVDVAIQIVLSKFGGKLSSGLMGALQKNPATQKVETQVLRGIVHSLINGVESRTISTYIRALYQNAFTQNKPITWSEFIDQLVTQITDPKSIVMDIVLGAVAAKARTKAVGDAGTPSKKPPQLTEGKKPITPPAIQPTEGVNAKPPQQPAEAATTTTKKGAEVIPIDRARAGATTPKPPKSPAPTTGKDAEVIPIGRARKPTKQPQEQPQIMAEEQPLAATGTGDASPTILGNRPPGKGSGGLQGEPTVAMANSGSGKGNAGAEPTRTVVSSPVEQTPSGSKGTVPKPSSSGKASPQPNEGQLPSSSSTRAPEKPPGGGQPPSDGFEDFLHEFPDFKAGSMVRVRMGQKGQVAKPSEILEVGAGARDVDLGIPPGIAQDPKTGAVNLTKTDIKTRAGVTELDATKPVPPEFVGKADTIIINNPRGYVPNVAELGKALSPGGRIIIQGTGKPPGAIEIEPGRAEIVVGG